MAWSKLNPCALVSHVLFKVRLPSAPLTPSGRPRPPLPLCQATRLDPRALILCLYADGRNRTINLCLLLLLLCCRRVPCSRTCFASSSQTTLW